MPTKLRVLSLVGVVTMLWAACTPAVQTNAPTSVDSGRTAASAVTTPIETSTTTNDHTEIRSVGLVGCSMTVDAVMGYRQVGGVAFWPIRGLGYGGGSVARWADAADQRGLRERFERALSEEGETKAIWWQLCTSGSENDDIEAALAVVSELERSLPEATIYVSPQPAYTNGHVCESAGPGGPARMAALADDLTSTGKVQGGPVFSPLAADELVDTCHAGATAIEQMGRELLAFFGENGNLPRQPVDGDGRG